jgi:hypothetical protein
MKPTKLIILAVMFLMGSSIFAGNAELIKSMKRQQKAAEAEIIDLWSNNKRGKELDKVLSDYVVREVRLRSITGTSKTGSLMGIVIKGGTVKFENPAQLAQALVLEDLRRKGIDKRPHYFVTGRYLIKGIEVDTSSLDDDDDVRPDEG